MAGTNNILQFDSNQSNLLSQSAYSTDGDRLNGNAYTTGQARSALINKALFQSSTISAAVAQFIVNNTGANVNDTDGVSTIANNLMSAVEAAAGTGGTILDPSNTYQVNGAVKHVNYFSGALTGIISIKIAGLVTATASHVDLGLMKIIITQDDRDHSSATNPASYEFLIKGNMDTGVWYNTQAICPATNATTSINVRFTRTATDAYVEIGDIGLAWSYVTLDVFHVASYVLTGYTPAFTSTLQNSLLGTTATDSTISVSPNAPLSAISGFATQSGNNSFTGTNSFSISPTAPTPTAGDSSTKVATTAFVTNILASAGIGTQSSVYGLIYNKTADTYKRFGTGTLEDNVWLSNVSGRLNDNSNSDAVTNFFNNPNTVQGNMKRVVVDNTGAYVKDYNATDYTHPDQTGLTATQTVMVKIPQFSYVFVNFTYNNDTYSLFAQSLNSFSIDLATLGFIGATSIGGQSATGYTSYGTIVGTVITSVIHNAFVHATEGNKSVMYLGAFESSANGSQYRSSCTASLTSTPIKAVASQTIGTFRTNHSAFGSRFQTYNWFQREALAFTLLIERGTFQTETNGTNNYSKWEAYTWNSSASSDDQNLGLTLGLLNSTGVIKNTSNQTIACSYRGVENPYGHLWEFVDGINVISGAIWLAKAGSAYASDTTASPYFSAGVSTLTSGSAVYISDISKGTFIPTATSGGSNVTKMTDGGWFATGNMVLIVGGGLYNPGISGVSAWVSNYASSASSWTLGSRFATLS